MTVTCMLSLRTTESDMYVVCGAIVSDLYAVFENHCQWPASCLWEPLSATCEMSMGTFDSDLYVVYGNH